MTSFSLGLGREDGNGGVGMGQGSVKRDSPRCKETPSAQEQGREGGRAGRFLEGRLVYDFLLGVWPGAPHTLPVHTSYLQKEIQGTSLFRISWVLPLSSCKDRNCPAFRSGQTLLALWLSLVPILAPAAGGLPWNC